MPKSDPKVINNKQANKVALGNTAQQVTAAIARNTEQIEELKALTEKIYRHVVWRRVFMFVKIAIIAIPIIIGAIYLPNYLRNSGLSNLLNPVQEANGVLESSGLLESLESLRELR
ncbi:hypothetical protein CL634_08520 [bacterium]|nr:hypothetical protein [bacterium]|tara:strand:- start:699 stop:1046 length:348 start_codon:yes stop_codon:yes gene_type:complete